tara:strand:- start:5566 stop:5874 length:309 start_codon:yes stop_codon:yes gene_type:complete
VAKPLSKAEAAKEIKDLIRDATPDAIRTLIDIATSQDRHISASQKISAAQILIEREMGKVVQPVDVSNSMTVIVQQINSARYSKPEPKQVNTALEDILHGTS